MGKLKILGTVVESRTLMAEEMLMIAVLEQALADLTDPCPAVQADAEAYFFTFGPDSSAFSFEAVCAQFKLSPSAIRKVLAPRVRRRPQQVPLEQAA